MVAQNLHYMKTCNKNNFVNFLSVYETMNLFGTSNEESKEKGSLIL